MCAEMTLKARMKQEKRTTGNDAPRRLYACLLECLRPREAYSSCLSEIKEPPQLLRRVHTYLSGGSAVSASLPRQGSEYLHLAGSKLPLRHRGRKGRQTSGRWRGNPGGLRLGVIARELSAVSEACSFFSFALD